jgi:hypothetical protein
MTDSTAPSLAQQVAGLNLEAHVTGSAWLGDTLAFALGDGTVALAKGEEIHRVATHPETTDASQSRAPTDRRRP